MAAVLVIEEPFVKAFQGQLTPSLPSLDNAARGPFRAFLQLGRALSLGIVGDDDNGKFTL
jgi:hypothetical protein